MAQKQSPIASITAGKSSETPSVLVRCGDIGSAIFALYWVYFFAWAAMTGAHATKPLQIQIVLLLADILPSVFAIMWFSYRYITDWSKRFPLLGRLTNSPLFKVIAVLSILALSIFNHMKGR